ncbi:MAG: trypsin-like peptidase domain-containing protein [Patescibacteria group bacterium]|nr:trypsin-like peptidase domain-containing protein [Patescibacteria group bacterium]
MSNKKLFVIVFATAILGVATGTLINSPQARASFWSNLFSKIDSGFSTSTASSTTSLGLGQSYSPPSSYEQQIINAVKQASPSVVSIIISQDLPVIEQCQAANPFANLPSNLQQLFGNQFNYTVPCQKGSKLQETGAGSGFIVSSDGLILTNKHVVSNTSAQYTVILSNGKKYNATVLARDPKIDLALIKINATGLSALALGDSSQLELGQTAIAIGNALGQFSNTVSVGVVSGLSRTITASGASYGSETIQGVIQTDAAINPGNSGGPLLNSRGQVIGIDTAVVSGAQNIGFAIPINDAKSDISQVETAGSISTPYLGVRYTPIDSALAAQDNLPVSNGALIQGGNGQLAVVPGSPAEKAGLKSGDIIISVDGVNIDQNNTLSDLISSHKVSDTVSLAILRDGKTITVQVTLAQFPNS